MTDGEDIVRASETLLSKRAYTVLIQRKNIHFSLQNSDDPLFPFYRATLAG